jgi:hypothetical protein
MKISELWHFVLSAERAKHARLGVCVATFVFAVPSNSAHAFGGVWSVSGQELALSAEQLVLVDNPDASVTAVVQLELTGPAQELSWVVPVPREPLFGLSSTTVFQRLSALTAPQYWVEVTDPCTIRPDGGLEQTGSLGESAAGSPEESPARVRIQERHAISPREHTLLDIAADSADPESEMKAALQAGGFGWSEQSSPQLTAYVRAGHKLLAFKLDKPDGTTFVRPLAFTYPSAELSIPLRASAPAARADMPLHVWAFSTAPAVPANYKTLVVNDALLDWQSAEKFAVGTLPANGAGAFGPIVPRIANYDAVITQAANEAPDGHGFLIEYTAPASHVRDVVWSGLDAGDLERVMTEAAKSDGIAAIRTALESFRNWDGLLQAIQANTKLPEAATWDELLADPNAFRERATVDKERFLEQLGSQVVGPVRDTASFMRATPYLTQLFTTLSADEMTLDPAFLYNGDLALITNVHIAKQYLTCEPGDDPRQAAWRTELPQGGSVVGMGTGPGSWPIAMSAMPANLKIVELATEGTGNVLTDNSGSIGRALFEAAGMNGTGVAIPRVPQNGLTIGADQTVVPQLRAGAADASLEPAAAQGCSATPARSPQRHTWLLLAACAMWLGLRRRRRGPLALGLLALFGCSEAEPTRTQPDAAPVMAAPSGGELSAEQLRDPESCKECHPSHYREWSGSMHAFASRDPVFRAMNARGQRETNGELGEFCVNCHAPMAVRDNLTKDGLNLDELGHEDRGVTCYFCHSVIGVEDTHNAQLLLAKDATLRGPFADALATHAHGAEQSKHFDENLPESSQMCGACHDIIMPKGVAIERTFKEYEAGLFAKSATASPPPFASCVGCHMQGRKGTVANVPGAPERIVHEHFWPGIDVAFGDFPHREAMRSAIEDCQLGNASVSYFSLEVSEPNLFTFQIETNAGHNQPSGASQDRRMWLEFLAYDADDNLIAEASSGNIADGELEEKPESDPKHDPQLILFGDRIFDENGKRVHMFWDAAKSAAYPLGYESVSLPVASTTYVEGKHVIVKQLRASGADGGLPARITARLRIRPIGIDVLDDLVQSGDLDPAIVAEMPTLTFGAQIAWQKANGTAAPVYAQIKNDCNTYRCLLDANDPQCQK